MPIYLITNEAHKLLLKFKLGRTIDHKYKILSKYSRYLECPEVLLYYKNTDDIIDETNLLNIFDKYRGKNSSGRKNEWICGLEFEDIKNKIDNYFKENESDDDELENKSDDELENKSENELENESDNMSNICQNCGKWLSSKRALLRHNDKKIKCERMECYHCKKLYFNKILFQYHMKDCNTNLTNNNIIINYISIEDIPNKLKEFIKRENITINDFNELVDIYSLIKNGKI